MVATVLIGWSLSTGHALVTRGWRTAAVLVAVTTGGGLAVEAVGVHTGFPFGAYSYGEALGVKVFGVPVVVPLAWTWMAWPAWLAAARLTDGLARGGRRSAALAQIGLAGVALATWDLFLDPQMVRAGYWRWSSHAPGLPGVGEIPLTNYLGWLVVALAMMALLSSAGFDQTPTTRRDAPMLGVYLWTYYSSVLAHAVFLGLRPSALWGGLGMGLVAIPLTLKVIRR